MSIFLNFQSIELSTDPGRQNDAHWYQRADVCLILWTTSTCSTCLNSREFAVNLLLIVRVTIVLRCYGI